MSRREFAALAATGALGMSAASGPTFGFAAEPEALTAQEVVDRIRQKIGIEWKADTVDTFKAGDPATVVKGIATTAMATITMLKQAVKAGANLVITGEPTFYSKADASAPAPGRRGGPPPAPDPVLSAKNDFIKSNGLVIWRFSDHWRQRIPDPLASGLADALGWSRFRSADDASRLEIPAITLEKLASEIRKKLNARGGLRVIGDPRLSVRKVGLLPGTTAIQASLRLLPQVDTLVAGEVREWETVEYVRDKVAAGEKKSLILLGRVVSEEPGMNVCAQWLKGVVPEVRTSWIPVEDPYWRPS